jgi:hypothetical protein
MATKEEKTAKEIKACDITKTDLPKLEKPLVCTICGMPATQLVDGEPSCADHIEQVYEHQVEDYTKAHLPNNEWRKV